MKDFIDWLVKAIVDRPGEVTATETEENGQTVLTLSVAKEDMGKVIGKGGKIIKALRTLVRIRALKENKRASLVLLEQQV